MRLVIAAVGKLKDAEERGICERYAQRLNGAGKTIGLGPLALRELSESRAATVAARRRDEAGRLTREIADESYVVALDPAGEALTSEAFAERIGRMRDDNIKNCIFMIGGPDGHGDTALNAANLRLSLGKLTLPHGLARVVLMEQLYRAATILSGHPYHRS